MRCLWMSRLAVVLGLLLAPAVLRAEHAPAEGGKPSYTVTIEKQGGEEIDKKLDLNKSDQVPPNDKEITIREFVELLEKGEIQDMRVDKPPSFLALRWDLGLWSLIVFLGLMFILGKVAWKPMLEGLRSREESIRRALEDAEQAKKETADLRMKLQAEMDKANEERRRVIEDARRDAQRTADELLARAKADIQAERDRAKRELEMARDQAIKDLLDQNATLASLVAAKAINRQLTIEDHRRLVDEALAELKQVAK